MQALCLSAVHETDDHGEIKLYLHNTTGAEVEGIPLMFALRCPEPGFYTPLGIESTDGIILPGECRGVLLQARDPLRPVESWRLECEGKPLLREVWSKQSVAAGNEPDARIPAEPPTHGSDGSFDALHNAQTSRQSNSSVLTTVTKCDGSAEVTVSTTGGRAVRASSLRAWSAVKPPALARNVNRGNRRTLSASVEPYTDSLEEDLVRSRARGSSTLPRADCSYEAPPIFVHYILLSGEKRSVEVAKGWLEAQQGKYERWIMKIQQAQGKGGGGALSAPRGTNGMHTGPSPRPSALGEPVRWVKSADKAPMDVGVLAFWRKPFSKASTKLSKVGKERTLCIRVMCELGSPRSNDMGGGPLCDQPLNRFPPLAVLRSLGGVSREETSSVRNAALSRSLSTEEVHVREKLSGLGHTHEPRDGSGRVYGCTSDRSPAALLPLRRHEGMELSGYVPFGKLEAPAGDGTTPPDGTLEPVKETWNGGGSLRARVSSPPKATEHCLSPKDVTPHEEKRKGGTDDRKNPSVLQWSVGMARTGATSASQVCSTLCAFGERLSCNLQSVFCATASTVINSLRLACGVIEGSVNVLYVAVVPLLLLTTICLLYAIVRGDSYCNELEIAIGEIG